MNRPKAASVPLEYGNLLKCVLRIGSLTQDELKLFLACAESLSLSRGECLLREGQICNHLYFVESGLLRTSLYDDHREANIGFTLDGQFVSNIKSLKLRQPSRCKISADEKTLVFRFEKGRLMELYNQSRALETFLRRILASLLIESNERIELLKLSSPTERYRFLLKSNPELIRRISVTHLSSYLGVARETLSRIRSKKV